MKRAIAILITLFVLSMSALPVAAQTRRYSNKRTVYSRYDNRSYAGYRTNRYRYDDRRYEGDYRYRDNRSVWERHRDKITTAAGAGGGAVVGGLVGGKKGAIIGAIAGGAGAALYTYKIRDKNRR